MKWGELMSIGLTSGELETECHIQGYSRHPNFAAEQSMWVVIYFFSVSASKELFNWSGVGAFLLILLFRGSVDLSEGISAGKYPEYKKYQVCVCAIILLTGLSQHM